MRTTMGPCETTRSRHSGQWSELAALYAENTIVRHPLASDASSLLEGRAALHAHFVAYGKKNVVLTARDIVIHRTPDPEVIIVDFTYDGVDRNTGAQFTMPACFIWRVRNGEVLESRDFVSPRRPVRTAAAKDIDLDETTADRKLRGERIIRELNAGRPQTPSLDALREELPFLSNAVTSFAVGDIFGRGVLDVRTRQLALCTAFAAIGLGDFIKVHGGYALDAGVREDELKEIVYLTLIPGGFPRAIMASQALSELFRQRR